ncbi:acnA, partial [Symbiodinium necroappetens]
DMDDFMALLATYDLVALNTWSRHSGAVHFPLQVTGYDSQHRRLPTTWPPVLAFQAGSLLGKPGVPSTNTIASTSSDAARRMQLRDSQGLMMSPSAEADLLHKHFQQRFRAETQDPQDPDMIHLAGKQCLMDTPRVQPDCISLPVLFCDNSVSALLQLMAALDQEIKEVFGDLAQNSLQGFGDALFGTGSPPPNVGPPTKAAKLEGAPGKRQRPSDNGSSPGSSGQWGNNKGRGKGSKQQPQLHALVHAMGRLIIRQETQLQILKQNSAWTLYLRPGPSGPVALLYKTAEKYREESKTKFMDTPVRAVLLHTLFQALLGSLQDISSSQEKQKVLQEKGWLNQDGLWNYQRWDGEQQTLVIDEARPPVNHQDLIGKVGQFAEIVLNKDVIHRFNATHSLSMAKTGTSTFLLEVGLRAQGVELAWAILEAISGLSALQVIGLQVRREGLRRGGLANEVQKLMNASAGWSCITHPTSAT